MIEIKSDKDRGDLVPIYPLEFGLNPIKRIMIFKNSPLNSVRGNHGHRREKQLFYIVRGEIEIEIETSEGKQTKILKENDYLQVLPFTWTVFKFTKKDTSFTNAYFASLINENPIKNTYKLDKHILITGPNAAGKTTLLKTTLFNIILSQQFGVGLYQSANINPYTYIHSYINIPDTSGRDSLFQAEARRCKEILDAISTSDVSERHFCIFDEIYSGTNPSEAIASAYSFLKYISSKNIDYILTTHYFSLCKMMKKVYRISNNQMEIKDHKNTYKLITGISNIKGGIKVLEELEYDTEIIKSAKKMVNKINI